MNTEQNRIVCLMGGNIFPSILSHTSWFEYFFQSWSVYCRCFLRHWFCQYTGTPHSVLMTAVERPLDWWCKNYLESEGCCSGGCCLVWQPIGSWDKSIYMQILSFSFHCDCSTRHAFWDVSKIGDLWQKETFDFSLIIEALTAHFASEEHRKNLRHMGFRLRWKEWKDIFNILACCNLTWQWQHG